MDLKECLVEKHIFHAFSTGQVTELCFKEDSQDNGRQVVFKHYNEINHHWNVHFFRASLGKVKLQNIKPINDKEFPFGDYCCDPQWNPFDHSIEENCIDSDNENTVYQRDTILESNAASVTYDVLTRKNDSERPSVFPSHMLFNLAHSCLTRYRRRFEGIRA